MATVQIHKLNWRSRTGRLTTQFIVQNYRFLLFINNCILFLDPVVILSKTSEIT